MCSRDEPLGIGALQAGETDFKIGSYSESSLRARTNADSGCDAGIRGDR